MRLSHYLLSSVILLLTYACSSTDDESAQTIVNKVQEVGKLELVEQRSEEVILISGSGENLNTISSLDDAITLIDDLLRIGDRIGVYSYSHYTIAYIDLSRLDIDDVDIDPKSKQVHITLPAIQVEPIGRSGDIKLLHERVTGTKKPITASERSKVQAEAHRQAMERMKPDTPSYTALVQQGEEQARAYFSGLIRSRGYEQVTIDFKSR